MNWDGRTMKKLHVLRFAPLFRRYIWGGRRLATVLGKNIGEGEDYAESWEVVDHGDDQSVVSSGPLAGTALNDLIERYGPQLCGRHHPLDQFPLLFKYLDAQRALSVQVHPNDQQAAELDPPDLGKTEAWVILAADPGSVIFAGLKRGFDRASLEREVSQGTTERCLHKFEPQAGDCIFLPAGIVHALGAGLVIAEIQQASDTTFRLFDWNRTDAHGKSRPLHIQEALNAINYDYGPVSSNTPELTDCAHVERLVTCDKFILDRWNFDTPKTAGADDRFHIVTVLVGEVSLPDDPTGEPLRRGDTALLPAAIGATTLHPHQPTTLLDIYLP